MKCYRNALWLPVLFCLLFIFGCGKKEEGTGGEKTIETTAETPASQNGKVNTEKENSKEELKEDSKENSKEDKENSEAAEDTDATIPQKIQQEDYAQIYSRVLDDFYAFITSGGDGSITVEGEGGVGEAIRSNEDDDNFAIVGYAIKDFSGDGIPELVIGDAGYGSTIYTMYACENGEPRCVLEGYHRSRYSWMGGNEIFYEGSGGAIYNIFAHYILSPNGGELICQDYYFSHETDETFKEIGFYHNSSGEMDPKVSIRCSSENEFWSLNDELRDKVQEIGLIPFSEYEPE